MVIGDRDGRVVAVAIAFASFYLHSVDSIAVAFTKNYLSINICIYIYIYVFYERDTALRIKTTVSLLTRFRSMRATIDKGSHSGGRDRCTDRYLKPR